MTPLDVGLFGMMFAGVAIAGYTLGRRANARPPAGKTAAEPRPAPAKPAEAVGAKLDPTSAAEPVPGPVPEPVPEPVLEPVTSPPAAVLDDVPILHNEGDEELEFTKVGANATAPPPSVERKLYQPPVTRIVFDPEAEAEEVDESESMFLVHATAQTDTGLRRKHNEDSVLVLVEEGLFVVADGMGGYKGGRIASQLVINTMEEAARSGEYEGPPHEEVPAEASELARAIQMANSEIQEHVGRAPDLQGMGTTVCAARFSARRSRLYIGHVGDSRCYRLRDGVFKMMTKDHTMAEHGVKGPESAHLSRAVGIWPTVPIDIIMAAPQVGDVYVLCSDGLTKMLNDDIIANVLRTEDHPKAAVERLILFANSRGGKDNVTVVLVRVVPPNWKPRSPSSDELVPP